ncbi:MAG: hypothetical protein M0R74_06155 [Dehalococcoidia bacterium]|nr:hypothetical protein [Dehalococcoidia bacterium]
MIIERLTFQAKYGQADALLEVLRAGANLSRVAGTPQRVTTDLTGRMFTVTWDFEYESMEQLAVSRAEDEKMYQGAEFQEWFGRMQPLVERGERQILQVVEF